MEPETYIHSKGTSKTFIQNDSHRGINQIDWNVDYDGNVADIDLNVNSNGSKKHYDMHLDNNDLANILNIPSSSIPLEDRLRNDFLVDRKIYRMVPVARRTRKRRRGYYRRKPLRRRSSRSRSSRSSRSSSHRKRRVLSRRSKSSSSHQPKNMRIHFNNTPI